MKIAVVEKSPTRVQYEKYFDFDFDRYCLTDRKIKKLKKADIELDLDILKDYEYVILVGAEPAKFIAKIGSVVKYAGHLIDDKYLPIFSPAMLAFRPDIKPAFEAGLQLLHDNIAGNVHQHAVNYQAIDKKEEAIEYLNKIKDEKLLAVDTETSALYPRDGYVLGVAISHEEYQGVYISTDIIDDEVQSLMHETFKSKKIVFHNAKFDRKFLEFHFNFEFPDWEDTMLMHYLLDENSPHDLKYLALRYTDMGEYDKDLDTYKREYCRLHKIPLKNFTYDLFPWEVISEYAAADTDATIRLYNKFNPIIFKAKSTIGGVYENILKPGTDFLIDVEQKGVPFNRDRLVATQKQLEEEIFELESKLYEFEEVRLTEKSLGARINFGSTQQLSKLLYSVLGLPIIERTATGAPSTNAEVLERLSTMHKIPELLLKVRKLKKIKATYIDKVLVGLDIDNHLRTGFNLHTVTSGRLSSSGKLNMQQLPRDDKRVKHCIEAPEGYVIVSQDLSTAEMYYAAVLSGDKALMSIFSKRGDFHSNIARMVFRIPESQELPKHLRQAAKAISFGILYGSGPAKVAEGANCTVEDARGYINTYFKQFKALKRWLDTQAQIIGNRGFAYSHFGRKRRVPEVFSSDSGVASGGVRSCVNFLIQSVASDVNLLASIELHNWLKTSNVDAYIFGLVHDSILAVVKETDLDEFTKMAKKFTQKDRGLSIPGSPIGIDVEVGKTYAFI